MFHFAPENLERIVEIAKLRAMQRKARFAKLKICVYKEEMPITPYERPLFNSLRFERSESEAKLFEHHCEVDVSFGPWEAVADVYDLLHCIVSDLADRGISADQQCIGVCDKHLINHYYCKRPIYEFKITWWWRWKCFSRCFAKNWDQGLSKWCLLLSTVTMNQQDHGIFLEMNGNINDKLLNKMAVIMAVALLFLHETAICNPKLSLWAAL